MRLHRTYILRLLVDLDPSGGAPELHGALQAVGDDHSHSFQSGERLLALLQSLTAAPVLPPDGARQDDGMQTAPEKLLKEITR